MVVGCGENFMLDGIGSGSGGGDEEINEIF